MFAMRTDPIDDADLAREREVVGGLADAARSLVDAVIRTTVDEDELIACRRELEAITARLQASQIPGAFGVSRTLGGTVRGYGNAVVGMRNAVAPPLEITQHPSGRATAEFHLGAAYEGPPGLVHGGVSALLLDQMLGEAAAAGGTPGMTGTLTVKYRRGTPLGDLRAEAWIERNEGRKTWLRGELSDAEGVCVEAEGLFILPAWALAAAEEDRPQRFE